MKIYLETHGCTFNQADSDIMINILNENHEMVDSIDKADMIILNTCYVKLPTEQKMITKIRTIEEKYPDKKLIIAGCMVEVDPIRLSKFSSKASWIGPHKIDKVDEIAERTLNGEIVRQYGKANILKAGANIKSNDSLIHILQICEGCSGGCTFCCTKSARGSLNSYPIEDIVEEARIAVENGCKELQVTAQDTACFGEDSGESFATLLEKLATIDGDFRIRVGMMHPKSLKRQLDDVIRVFKQYDKIYNFIHLPVQTGSPKVLEQMNRLHTLDEFKEMVELFRKEIPSLSLATDIIVGYPTETDDDFNQTLELIEEIKPDIIHISKYMHRPTAKSNTLEEIPHNVMKERSHKLNDLKTKVMLENNRNYEGSIQNVLITSEGVSGGYVGYTDSYKNIIIDEAVIGEFMKVEIVEGRRTYLLAKSINKY